MFLSCVFIRKNNSFVLNKIYTNLSQVCFLLILIIHFEVRFFVFFMLNKHTPFPICSLAKESIFAQRGLSGHTRPPVFSSWAFLLKGACRGTLVLLSFPHEQCGYLGSYRDLFPFLAVLSTILFNIKIP